MKRAIPFILLMLLIPAHLPADPQAAADRIEVAGGAVIVGQIESVEEGSLVVRTDYAGILRVDAGKVRSVTPGDGRELDLPGNITVAAAKPEPVPAAAAPALKPEVPAAPETHSWVIEGGVNLTGRSGNTERMDLRLTLEAELERKHDRSNLYGRYAYGTNRSVQSADEIIIGGRYTNFLFNRTGLFLRQELEQDEFEGIWLRSTSAGGVTYQFRREKGLRIEARSGMSYRYEDYTKDGEEDFLGMDIGLDVNWDILKWAQFKGTYTYLPSISDTGIFLIEQDSGVNLSLGEDGRFKLRLGIVTQYNNQPDPGRDKMDTRYYARLIAQWR
jgi:putative salt-induced outer membrane protein YdiY